MGSVGACWLSVAALCEPSELAANTLVFAAASEPSTVFGLLSDDELSGLNSDRERSS